MQTKRTYKTAVSASLTAMLAFTLTLMPGCGKKGLEGTYETKESIFEAERVVIGPTEATAGAGQSQKTYSWTREGDTVVLTRPGETRRLEYKEPNLTEGGKTFERK